MLPLMHHVSCTVFWQNIRSPRWLSPPTAQIWHPLTSGFPKSEITFKREEISDRQWDSGKYDGAPDGDWENCVRSQGAYFEGDWGIIVLRTMNLISSSVNGSIFQSVWLDTFWTDLIYFTKCPPAPPMCLVPTWHHTQSLQCYYGPCAELYIPVTYSVPTNVCFSVPSPISPSPPTPLPSASRQAVLSIYESEQM